MNDERHVHILIKASRDPLLIDITSEVICRLYSANIAFRSEAAGRSHMFKVIGRRVSTVLPAIERKRKRLAPVELRDKKCSTPPTIQYEFY